MRPQRIALFASGVTTYDLDMLFGLSRGFNAFGIETYVSVPLLSPEMLSAFCQHYHPSVVLEINRSRTQLPDLPKDILHIGWMQDYVGGVLEQPSSSEITYFIMHPKALGYKHQTKTLESVLLMGVDETAYSYGQQQAISDFSFVGYIPRPLNRKARHFRVRNELTGNSVNADTLLDLFAKRYMAGSGQLDYQEVHQLVYSLIQELTAGDSPNKQPTLGLDDANHPTNRPPRLSLKFEGSSFMKVLEEIRGGGVEVLQGRSNTAIAKDVLTDITILLSLLPEVVYSWVLPQKLPTEVMHLFDDCLVRLADRTRLIDAILSVSDSLRIYGPGTWQLWKRYKRYYQGYLSKQADMRQVYQTSQINLHNNTNGLGMHARVLDCMASGGFILVNESPNEFLPGGIRQFFEPGVHYAPYQFDQVAEVAREYLPQAELRQKIGEVASREVLAHHTWKHRAEQILNDLKQF